jgi:hypothetical protein
MLDRRHVRTLGGALVDDLRRDRLIDDRGRFKFHSGASSLETVRYAVSGNAGGKCSNDP